MLTVNVSPDFLPDETSSDVTVLEGDQVNEKIIFLLKIHPERFSYEQFIQFPSNI